MRLVRAAMAAYSTSGADTVNRGGREVLLGRAPGREPERVGKHHLLDHLAVALGVALAVAYLALLEQSHRMQSSIRSRPSVAERTGRRSPVRYRNSSLTAVKVPNSYGTRANGSASPTICVMQAAHPDPAHAQRDGLALLLRRAPLDELDRAADRAAPGRRAPSDQSTWRATLETSAKTVRQRVERLTRARHHPDHRASRRPRRSATAPSRWSASSSTAPARDRPRGRARRARRGRLRGRGDRPLSRSTSSCFCRDRAELARTVDDRIRTSRACASAEVFPYLSLHYQQAQFASARSKTAGAPGVRPVRLEPLDRAIIGELTHDGRRPFLQIARNLGISEAQVRQRVRQITTSGVAEIIAIANPLGLGYTTTAWIAITRRRRPRRCADAGRPPRRAAGDHLRRHLRRPLRHLRRDHVHARTTSCCRCSTTTCARCRASRTLEVADLPRPALQAPAAHRRGLIGRSTMRRC